MSDQTARPAAQPVRWKLWPLMVGGIYPIITAPVAATEPLLLRRLPLPVEFALVVPVMVAVMVWFVLPLLHRVFGGWLRR